MHVVIAKEIATRHLEDGNAILGDTGHGKFSWARLATRQGHRVVGIFGRQLDGSILQQGCNRTIRETVIRDERATTIEVDGPAITAAAQPQTPCIQLNRITGNDIAHHHQHCFASANARDVDAKVG